ncbi:MAG: penicillin-binding transpeptidase domain-containing protein, partial [Acidobacteriota bacterium]
EGTGIQANAAPWGSGGKTATAQTGQIGPDGNEILNTWFVGFFPAHRPRWVVTVMVERGQSGGRDAAPVFKEIAEKVGNIFLGK